MFYDFIKLCVGATSKEDDKQGQRTSEYLSRCWRVMQLLLSNHPSSLGLHPVVYFYSWTGKQQPILFLTMAEMIVDLERSKKLPQFIEIRSDFEEFLVQNRPLLNQVIRKYGTKSSGSQHLREFYDDVIASLRSSKNVIEELVKNPRYSYLQPGESPYDGVVPTKFSTQVKSGLVIRDLLPTALRCAICKGYLPGQALSVDHEIRVQVGGTSTVDNAQLTHPYCNTGYKESQVARARKSQAGM